MQIQFCEDPMPCPGPSGMPIFLVGVSTLYSVLRSGNALIAFNVVFIACNLKTKNTKLYKKKKKVVEKYVKNLE